MIGCAVLRPEVQALNRRLVLFARQDPTRTGGLRRRFLAEMGRRWAALGQAVLQFVGTRNALKLEAPIRHEFLSFAYDFPHTKGKEVEFRAWLDRQFAAAILAPEGGREGAPVWAAPYVRSAYRTGLFDGVQAAQMGGAAGEEFVRTSFAQPETVSKLRSLYTRSYELLRGMTKDTGRELGEILARGIADGRHPVDIAQEMVRRIETLSRTRAATIARTEVIYAHAEGQLDAFERLDLRWVGLQAEWSTAGDERVCDVCAALEGKVYQVEEARGLIPQHPNCRCTWIPLLAKAQGKTRGGEAAEKERVEGAAVPVRLSRASSLEALKWENMGGGRVGAKGLARQNSVEGRGCSDSPSLRQRDRTHTRNKK